MKTVKSAVAVLLCLVMLVSFAACGKKGEDTDTSKENGGEASQMVDVKEQTLEEAGLSLDKIIKANKIEALMQKYDTVTVKSLFSDGTGVTKQVFRYDGEPGLVVVNKEATGIEIVSGWIKGFEFSVEGDRVKAYRDIRALDTEAEFEDDDLVSSLFEERELVIVGASDDSYKLKSLSEDKADGSERYFYIDKATLALTKITYNNAVGKTENTEIIYNGELEAFAKQITDAFDGELKAVSINGEFADGEKISVKLELPSDWEYIPSGEGRFDYCMDEEMTEGYVYPGHGEDYTLYISDIFNEVDNGKK